jgi:hypothetical protein
MYDSACNFFLNENFNANFDITWSFQYNVNGLTTATGGFCTFLFANDTLVGGGRYAGYGYLNYLTMQGVKGAALGIIFDANNNIKIYKNSNFTLLSTFPLFTELSPLVKQNNVFNLLKFNLTDVGKTLKISIKDSITNNYKIIKTVYVNLPVFYETFYKVGFSYSSPIDSMHDSKITFSIKDIHVQGNQNLPDITYKTKPYEIQSYYLLQSPTGDKIKIHDTIPSSSGYIKYK